MDIPAIKQMVSDAYAYKDGDESIPRFSTQFLFKDQAIVIRIPIFEALRPPKPLIELICRIGAAVSDDFNKSAKEMEQLVLAAIDGEDTEGKGLIVVGKFICTSDSGRTSVSAVTECQVIFRYE